MNGAAGIARWHVSTSLVPPELLPCRKDTFRRKSQIVGMLAYAASPEGGVVCELALTRILMKSDGARLIVGSRSLQQPTTASSGETLAAVLG
jgi:hypothetical protein